MEPRLRALCDLAVAESREAAGRHEYDGQVQDLSPGGVRRGLAALGGDPIPDPYDEALVRAQEAAQRACYGELRLHRRNPMPHLANLDVSGYDREYAPAEQRAEARTQAPVGLAGRGRRLDRRAGRGHPGHRRRHPVRGPRAGRPAWTRPTRSRARRWPRRPGWSRTWRRPPAPATAATATSGRPRSAPTG